MKRRRGGAKRLNVEHFAAMFADPRSENYVANVARVGSETTHWRREGNEIIVGVVTVPDGIELEAVLMSNGDIWRVPEERAEVLVVVPNKDLGFRPFVVAVTKAPARASDTRTVIVAPDRIELIAPTIVLSSDGVAGEPLITKSQFDAHVHPTPSAPGTSGVPNNVATSGTTIVRGA